MSQRLPDTKEAMLQIPHVTEANFAKYGKALLNITQKYAAEKTAMLLENDTTTTGIKCTFTSSDIEDNDSIDTHGVKRKIDDRLTDNIFRKTSKRAAGGSTRARRGKNSTSTTSTRED
ncbi:Bloom syndrome protein homolog [Temnothorax curvispinosus]|uniref:Bloom syndrome protein homolog n=1 Tax=Temnothorax curvispinosus TaxID=300111 RepID=A0A6J1QJE1_9HYME|nr:Bloom syndrome protein homolog [Temnothorax curvispinosus]